MSIQGSPYSVYGDPTRRLRIGAGAARLRVRTTWSKLQQVVPCEWWWVPASCRFVVTWVDEQGRKKRNYQDGHQVVMGVASYEDGWGPSRVMECNLLRIHADTRRWSAREERKAEWRRRRYPPMDGYLTYADILGSVRA